MMRAILIVALLLVLPLAQAESGQVGIDNPSGAAVTLHMHLVGWGNGMPINTQPAQFGFTPVPLPLLGPTFTCLPNPPSASLLQEHHTYRGFSTPGYVQYDRLENGLPYIHPERELGYGATLDVGVAPVLHWYMETTTGATLPGGAPQPPVVVPNVIVQATLRSSAGATSPDDTSYDAGPIIAQGRSKPALLAADASQGVEHSMPEGHHVYGFTVPMSLESPEIGDRGFTLRIDVFLDNPACADPGGAGSVMPNLVLPFADPGHRPNLTTAVLDPLRITRLEPEFVGGDVVVHGLVQSVWGNHDVDEGNLSLTVDGPAGHQSLQPTTIVQRYREHGHHTDPVNITWVFNRTHAPPGRYWFNFTATNDQHTANATATAAANLEPDQMFPATPERTSIQVTPRAMPGLGTLAALAALAFGLRRARSATVKRKNGR